jgi:uncharacterized protein YrrD
MDVSTETTPQPSVRPPRDVDPHSRLHVDMRVIGDQGKTLGKVESLSYDETTGKLYALTVEHGMLRHKVTPVPARLVREVNENAVLLDMNADAFKRLADGASK